MFQNDREVKSHWGMMGKGSAPQQPSSPPPPTYTHSTSNTGPGPSHPGALGAQGPEVT